MIRVPVQVMLKAAAGLACLVLAACVEAVPPAPAPPAAAPSAPFEPPPRSAESEKVAAYFARLAANMRSQGLLRTDSGASDAPWGPADLIEDFVRIALYDEYVVQDGSLVARATPSELHRWQGPVRIGIEFGPSVPNATRAAYLTDVPIYTDRLARATGHPVRFVDANANFTVLVLNEDERRAIGPRLRQIVPQIKDSEVRAVTAMSESDYCLVIAFSPGSSAVYSRAVAVMRAEHPDALRRLCIHEELAQGLGLVNDSPDARPSIFNDDEEFALLTPHDELLLRILYDRRLKPGMTEAEARPIVETIVRELTSGQS
ncbi:MAG: DUF2927 domain-containing protein [Rhodobacteraceae bacterium]|nr:DUF2927 domain-containing protein [Paracoccaceae bacterium]